MITTIILSEINTVTSKLKRYCIVYKEPGNIGVIK